MKHFVDKSAKVIAYLFHPIFAPCYFILFIFLRNYVSGFNRYSSIENMEQAKSIIALSILFISTIPLLLMALFVRTKLVSSLQAEEQGERSLPFLSALTSGLVGFVLLHYNYTIPPILTLFYMGYLFAIGFALLINQYTKISIHMIGIGGIIGGMILLCRVNQQIYLAELTTMIGIAGLIAFSRLRLKAHSSSQVGLGLILGLVCELYPLFFMA